MPVAVQIDSEELYDVLRSLDIDEKTSRRVTQSVVSTRVLEHLVSKADLVELENRLVLKLGGAIAIATTLITTVLGILIILK